MKRASYRQGVEWIALNDDPGSSDALQVESVRGYISTGLLADLFGKDAERVQENGMDYDYRSPYRKGR